MGLEPATFWSRGKRPNRWTADARSTCHCRQSLSELQERDLPELRNKLQGINRDIEKLKSDTEEQESLLSALIAEEETAKACLQDIALMDRYQVGGSMLMLMKRKLPVRGSFWAKL